MGKMSPDGRTGPGCETPGLNEDSRLQGTNSWLRVRPWDLGPGSHAGRGVQEAWGVLCEAGGASLGR